MITLGTIVGIRDVFGIISPSCRLYGIIHLHITFLTDSQQTIYATKENKHTVFQKDQLFILVKYYFHITKSTWKKVRINYHGKMR